MEYIIKRNISLLGKNNIIKFGYNVKINSNKHGFEDFDIGNEEVMIDSLLEKIIQTGIVRKTKFPLHILKQKFTFLFPID